MTAANRIGETTFTTPSDREIVITRVFDAPRELVFEALTNSEHVPQWYGPRGWTLPVCDIDLRPGGDRCHTRAVSSLWGHTTGERARSSSMPRRPARVARRTPA